MLVGIFTQLQPTLVSRNQTQVCIGKGGRDFNFCVKFPDLTVLALNSSSKKRHCAIRSNKTSPSCPFADSLYHFLRHKATQSTEGAGWVRVCRRGVHGIPPLPLSWNLFAEQRLPCTVPETESLAPLTLGPMTSNSIHLHWCS